MLVVFVYMFETTILHDCHKSFPAGSRGNSTSSKLINCVLHFVYIFIWTDSITKKYGVACFEAHACMFS
jgi:hypothetical protein